MYWLLRRPKVSLKDMVYKTHSNQFENTEQTENTEKVNEPIQKNFNGAELCVPIQISQKNSKCSLVCPKSINHEKP